MGIHEVLEELVDTFPDSVWSSDADRRKIFQVAVTSRSENVFNLIYQMGDHKQHMAHLRDRSGNTILHLAGKLAPAHKLNLVSGAALQMQRELQWFEEVKKFVIPAYNEIENDAKKTPAMVFSEEHKDLVIEGEKWMKDTANSCTIAAALIATVVFAAALTVPGGDNPDGLPNFSKETGFITFVVSDAISLFTSTASMLMFLSILTSRYAEQDFLYILPKRLIIGLVTLFLSITSMMITFSATLYLVFGHKKAWILMPVAALACLPVTLFVSLQFPLLVDVISSTYGPGIFGKQSERPFY
ncbi:ankyrin repeat-containing protein ITN1-like [Cornus florida]|uniref:ankyrin repeat-containing protein ITN1-like n=1 Tax=Cornus florida TaxID=4283 RepID=UPI0028A1088B|nr:ankyrin repeat-containing protein ITN1-like [Cornus florida]XP_059637105.1 ankyrin repeat-containing protein ITN1-like [Cornus florida]